MRLGIFGGSFDPVHKGHLLLAGCCAEQAKLDRVLFIPAAYQPLKPSGPIASDIDRIAMLELACAEQQKFIVDSLEIDRGGVSYTIDTLAAIKKLHPTAELFFLMGADSLADLPHWHRPADICQLATPLIVHRAESPQPDFSALSPLLTDDRVEEIQQHQVNMPPTPISSTEIRKQIAANANWQELVPPPVANYIQEHKLYRQ